MHFDNTSWSDLVLWWCYVVFIYGVIKEWFMLSTYASHTINIYWSLSDYYYIEKTTYLPSGEPSALSCRGKLLLRCWAFAWQNDCANGDEADFMFVQTQKMQSLYCVLIITHESKVESSPNLSMYSMCDSLCLCTDAYISWDYFHAWITTVLPFPPIWDQSIRQRRFMS